MLILFLTLTVNSSPDPKLIYCISEDEHTLMLKHFSFSVLIRRLAPCKNRSIGKKVLTHVPCFVLIFPIHLISLSYHILFLFLSVSSTVSPSHQFPSLFRQQSLILQSLKESMCVLGSRRKKNLKLFCQVLPCNLGYKNQLSKVLGCSRCVKLILNLLSYID